MRVLSRHGRGLTPDTSAEGAAHPRQLAAKDLHAVTELVPSGPGRGLTPDMASREAS
jgi:hypothetical protein